MNDKKGIYSILAHGRSFKLKLMAEGVLVGVFSGFLVVFYRIALEKAEELRHGISDLISANPKFIPIWFAVLIASGVIVGYMVKKEPLISGSGIPQVEGVLQRRLEMNWLSVMIRKIAGSVIAIGSGLSLGREGPSIQLGAAAGQGVSRIFKRLKVEEKYLITSGASAGLAAAFNAPLAGVMFSLEELHRHFSPLILLSAMSASLTADFISKHFYGLKPVFNFQRISPLPLESYGYIIILGVIAGLCGALYNKVLLKTQSLYAGQKWLPVQYRPVIPFIAAGFLLLILPQVLGGGHPIIDSLIRGSYTMKMMLVVLTVKFAFSMLSFGSGAPGGIFFPLLVLGALTGAIYGSALTSLLGFEPEYISNFIILAMAGYFTAIVRAPITGSILITEMTGSLSHLLSLSLVSIVAYATADLLKSEPIYESLLERLLKNQGKHEPEAESKDKVMLEIPVFLDSSMDCKRVKELELPKGCLIVSIRRGNKEIIPKGGTVLCSGDDLIVLANEDEAAPIKQKLLEMSSKPQV
ncbi:ClC family H(+)/Cl(-) exchange transporter [Lutispora saccharofermentans]|uniref:Chloride channel protein n=1 Tax=Lutispora saccharofermentans TaxID=3024236 RepID=A0ABT1NCX3_9FIRM|nr:ClC family H(+)/Cl(-) exchange transporter [Lutispora saccharofermentans]MCQ1529103.1 chloride channel protein [Lutispora saccharofermentans]